MQLRNNIDHSKLCVLIYTFTLFINKPQIEFKLKHLFVWILNYYLRERGASKKIIIYEIKTCESKVIRKFIKEIIHINRFFLINFEENPKYDAIWQ